MTKFFSYCGNKRIRQVFASTAFGANLMFGNLNTNNLKTNPTTLNHEKVISNQEFNNPDGSHNSGKIIRTGNGTSFEFQQEISDTSLNDMDKIILVKNDGILPILPGAEGFPLDILPLKRAGAEGFPLDIIPLKRDPKKRGILFNLNGQNNQRLNIPKIKSIRVLDNGLNAQRGNRGNQCSASEPKFDMYKIHQNFVRKMRSKGFFVDNFDFDCGLERFKELSINPQKNVIDGKSINETTTILQCEHEYLVNNARRPDLKEGERNLDFVIDGPDSYTYADVKNPIDPRGLVFKNKKKRPTFDTIAEDISKSIVSQKKGPDKVLHIVNLERVPAEFKENMTKNIIEGVGSSKDIIFIN